MEDEKGEGLKEGENDTQEKQPNSENDSAEKSGLKDGEEGKKDDNKAKADKLLDGTDRGKKIVIKKEVYDEKNEKSKIYEAHAELLDSVLQDPEAVKKFLAEKKDSGGVEKRLAELEEDRKSEKRAQMRDAVAQLISEHSDFEKSWSEVEPIAATLMRQGYSVRAALRRGYLAVHPEAAETEARRIAEEVQNRDGEFRGSGFPVRQKKDTSALSDNERQLAQGLIKQGRIKTEDEYAKILEKHHDWIERQMRNVGE